MTVCKKCNGTGEITVPVEEHLGTVLYGKEQCDVCNGTGEVEQTEQEYIQTCNTEQLAEWIARRVNESVETALYDEYLHDGKIDWRDYMVRSDDVIEWLKQPHTKG